MSYNYYNYNNQYYDVGLQNHTPVDYFRKDSFNLQLSDVSAQLESPPIVDIGNVGLPPCYESSAPNTNFVPFRAWTTPTTPHKVHNYAAQTYHSTESHPPRQNIPVQSHQQYWHYPSYGSISTQPEFTTIDLTFNEKTQPELLPFTRYPDDRVHQYSEYTANEFENFKTQEITHKKQRQPYCSICQKYFSQEQYYMQHLETHNDRRHRCSKCGKRFETNAILLQHMLRHNPSNKRHPCNLCEKSFNFKPDLKRHVDSKHLNRYKHVCHICTRKFLRLDHLNRHVKGHFKISKTKKQD